METIPTRQGRARIEPPTWRTSTPWPGGRRSGQPTTPGPRPPVISRFGVDAGRFRRGARPRCPLPLKKLIAGELGGQVDLLLDAAHHDGDPVYARAGRGCGTEIRKRRLERHVVLLTFHAFPSRPALGTGRPGGDDLRFHSLLSIDMNFTFRPRFKARAAPTGPKDAIRRGRRPTTSASRTVRRPLVNSGSASPAGDRAPARGTAEARTPFCTRSAG